MSTFKLFVKRLSSHRHRRRRSHRAGRSRILRRKSLPAIECREAEIVGSAFVHTLWRMSWRAGGRADLIDVPLRVEQQQYRGQRQRTASENYAQTCSKRHTDNASAGMCDCSGCISPCRRLASWRRVQSRRRQGRRIACSASACWAASTACRSGPPPGCVRTHRWCDKCGRLRNFASWWQRCRGMCERAHGPKQQSKRGIHHEKTSPTARRRPATSMTEARRVLVFSVSSSGIAHSLRRSSWYCLYVWVKRAHGGK
eukprot:SAG11_NODE_863_length_6839_cov_4.857418_2_plen_256_part_00